MKENFIETRPSVSSYMVRLILKYFVLPRLFNPNKTVEQQRKVLETLSKMAALPRGTSVNKVNVNGIPAEWVEAANVPKEDESVILYFHGGGFILGSCNTHRDLAAGISMISGVRVLLIDYRLAPEHRFPAANDDCLAAYRWLLESGVPPGKIVIGGDSAGGCLTMMTLLSLRDAGDPMPAAAFMLSPLLDTVNFDGESYVSRKKVDLFFYKGADMFSELVSHFLGDLKEKPLILSPVRNDLKGMPPLFLQAGDNEVLLSDSTRLAERAENAGVDVTLEIWENMWHVFQTARTMPEGKKALENIGSFVQRHIGSAVISDV